MQEKPAAAGRDRSGVKMDIKDLYDVGNGIVDAVNEAVKSGDYSKLNASLRNMTGNGGAGTGGTGYGTGNGNSSGTGAGGRTYGHAGRASENVTEQYMKRAAGARHHTSFTSKVSPFLQRQVSRGSGNGKIAGGIVCFVMALYSLRQTLVGGLVSGVFSILGGSGGFGALVIFPLIVTLGLGILGAILVKNGQERKKLVREYYEYGRVAGSAEYLEISRLANAVGESRETVLANLEKMIEEDMLPAAWFDRQKTTIMLSEELYNEYLRLERERQAQQEEEEKARMAARTQQAGAYGNLSGGTAEPGRTAAEEDADLKLRPEDEKLPARAKEIVKEGLLYMGRIRAFNREIGDEEISAELAHLDLTMKRIIEQIRKDPSSAQNLRRLMVYYLPTTMKLLQAYVELDRQPVAGENITSTKQEIREALATINIAFEKLLDSLFQDMAWDISSDISVMKTMMQQDGLTGDGMREAAAAAAGQAQPPFRDGFSEGLTGTGMEFEEDMSFAEGAAGADPSAASAAAADPAAGEADQGIRLTFGE